MNQIVTAKDLDELRSLPRALLFIYVDWAAQARHSKSALCDFETVWASTASADAIPIHCVDLSSQEGEIWTAIRAWLKDEGQPYDLLTYGGCGALIWIRWGTVTESVPCIFQFDRVKLMASTKEL
jgi:hypothetical protein